jgi:hypothetical protein
MADAKTDFNVDVNFKAADYSKITRDAVNSMAKDLEAAERADIAAAGMARYAKQTRVRVRDRGDRGYEVQVIPKPGWMRAFEYGSTSAGNPMLWIPVRGSIFRHMRARNYPGKLIRPKGSNILINAVTRKVAYIGIQRSTISPTLQLRQIAEDEASKFVGHVMESV